MASSVQTTSQDGTRSRRRLPFDASERKKIIVLAVLGVVCAAVVLPQLLKHKGPAQANAAAPAGADAAATLDIDAVVQEMRTSLNKPIQSPSGETVFTTVDEALELFVGGLRPQPIPAEALQLGVFGVPKASTAETMAKAAPAALKAVPALDPEDPLKAELAKLTLETVMISSRNQAAIVNGQVLHVGEMVDGFKITAIEMGRVAVMKDGRTALLTLKQEPLPGK